MIPLQQVANYFETFGRWINSNMHSKYYFNIRDDEKYAVAVRWEFFTG